MMVRTAFLFMMWLNPFRFNFFSCFSKFPYTIIIIIMVSVGGVSDG